MAEKSTSESKTVLAMSDEWHSKGYQFCPSTILPKGTSMELFSDEIMPFDAVVSTPVTTHDTRSKEGK
jgi:hypothetical protein